MGKAKTQRTEALHQAARRYTVAVQAQQAIAQHNLDKLVAQGVIMTEPTDGRLSISEQTTYGDLKEECARAGAKKGVTPQGGR